MLQRLHPFSPSNEWVEIWEDTRSVTKKLGRQFRPLIRKLGRVLRQVKRFLIKVNTNIFRKLWKIVARSDWGFFIGIIVLVRILIKGRRYLRFRRGFLRRCLELLLIGLPLGLLKMATVLWIVLVRLMGILWQIL